MPQATASRVIARHPRDVERAVPPTRPRPVLHFQAELCQLMPVFADKRPLGAGLRGPRAFDDAAAALVAMRDEAQ